MSTRATGADTLALLRGRGHEVVLAPRMRDVDEARDAELAALEAPHTRFAAAWRQGAATTVGGRAS
jgi:hypothetical protein